MSTIVGKKQYEQLKAELAEQNSPGLNWDKITEKYGVTTNQLSEVYNTESYQEYVGGREVSAMAAVPSQTETPEAPKPPEYTYKKLANGREQYRLNGKLVAKASVPEGTIFRVLE